MQLQYKALIIWIFNCSLTKKRNFHISLLLSLDPFCLGGRGNWFSKFRRANYYTISTCNFKTHIPRWSFLSYLSRGTLPLSARIIYFRRPNLSEAKVVKDLEKWKDSHQQTAWNPCGNFFYGWWRFWRTCCCVDCSSYVAPVEFVKQVEVKIN